MCIPSKIFEVRFVIRRVINNAVEDKTEQSYEIKSLPFNKNEMKNYLKSHNDEQYIVIDLTKLYLHKINDRIALTFAFNPSYPLLENHFILGKISKNRLKLLDKDGLIYTVEL